MWYRGNLKRCEEYNAIVSYQMGVSKMGENITKTWALIEEINGTYYILKHPNFDGAYLVEIEIKPEVISLVI